MAESWADLLRMGDDEIVRKHDEAAVHTAEGVAQYRAELARRDAQRQGDRLEAMTRVMARLTWIVAGCTVVITAATIAMLYLALWKG